MASNKRAASRGDENDTQETITVSRAGTMKINIAVVSFIFALFFQGGSFVWWASGQAARLTAVEAALAAMQVDIKADQISRNDTNTQLASIGQYVKDLRDMWFNRPQSLNPPQPTQVYIPANSQAPQVIMQQAPSDGNSGGHR